MKRLGNVLTDAALRHVDIPVNVSVTVGNPNAQNQQQEVVRTADTIQDKAVLKYLQAVYVHDRTSFRVTEGELSADQQRLVDHRSAARQATIAGYVKDISARGSHGLPPKLVQHFNETRAAEKRAARVAAAKRAGAAVTSTVAQAARAVIPPKVEYPKDEQGREYEFRRVRGADGQVREERVYRSKGESWLSKVFTRANR